MDDFERPRLLTNFDKKDLEIYRKVVAIYDDPDLEVKRTYREFNYSFGLWDYSNVEDRTAFWNLFDEIKNLDKIMEEANENNL
jgi:hypothetical protein